jgi:hypothetical protein
MILISSADRRIIESYGGRGKQNERLVGSVGCVSKFWLESVVKTLYNRCLDSERREGRRKERT